MIYLLYLKYTILWLFESGPFLIVWSFLNTLAWIYGSTQALPWSTIILLGALWLICELFFFNINSFIHFQNFKWKTMNHT